MTGEGRTYPQQTVPSAIVPPRPNAVPPLPPVSSGAEPAPDGLPNIHCERCRAFEGTTIAAWCQWRKAWVKLGAELARPFRRGVAVLSEEPGTCCDRAVATELRRRADEVRWGCVQHYEPNCRECESLAMLLEGWAEETPARGVEACHDR